MPYQLLIAILAYPFATSTQSPPEIAGFDWVRTITLDERVDIAEFSSIDIDAVGRMAMTDNILRKAYLFDADGKLSAALDPAACFPGYPFNPISIRFGWNSSLFLVNSGIWGFRFHADGRCIGLPHDAFIAPASMTAAPGNTWIALYKTSTEARFLRLREDGLPIDTLSVQPLRRPVIDFRLMSQGVVHLSGGFAYATGSHATPSAVRNGRHETWSASITGANEIRSDIRAVDSTNPAALMAAMVRLRKENSMTLMLTRLDAEHILHVVSVPEADGSMNRALVVYRNDGMVASTAARSSLHVLGARHGHVYLLESEDRPSRSIQRIHVLMYRADR
jgi:hypothetical protein